VQLTKEVDSILSTLLGIVIDFKDVQLEKALPPIDTTLFESIILFKEVQTAKALAPISVTPLGIIMLFKDEQQLNAPLPITFTLLGIDTLLFFAGQVINVSCCLLYRTPSIELNSGFPEATLISSNDRFEVIP
jgi:hypothetical protein